MAEGPENVKERQSDISSSKEDVSDSAEPVKNEEEEVLQNIFELDYQPDCPVCLQQASYPVRLPCGHMFCFLCIKGVALRSRKCAICRQPISPDYLDKPTLVKVVSGQSSSSDKAPSDPPADEYVWFYEGRNGWWQYDTKTSKEVESAFKGGKRSCTLLIAGFLYLIDFENMFQMRRNEPGRRRRIKRDKPNADRKGVAGIRLKGLTVSELADLKNQTTETSTADNQWTSTEDVSVQALSGSPTEAANRDCDDSASSTSDKESAPDETTHEFACFMLMQPLIAHSESYHNSPVLGDVNAPS
ncbi:E3 ubiquitin-protein ligase RNF146 isoform X2 [Nematostella vectensis]|uniref:E3 ubiquitin-protein ligase RNF146 isoform X2 n=1 Tax=Nematostella vectensis TaxID=45351 RepID=UPI00138FFF8D|nr:E3 ubiquitin-protein ligase RNF146 isoform X2 [Nematostella vectensis]